LIIIFLEGQNPWSLPKKIGQGKIEIGLGNSLLVILIWKNKKVTSFVFT
jgi:hypothetical protein